MTEKGKVMSKLIQSVTLKIETNHDQALEEIKKLKTFLKGRGVEVRAFWAIEAGAESGTATIAMEFPNASAWGAMVDSQDAELEAMRRRGVESGVAMNTALLQEIDLS